MVHGSSGRHGRTGGCGMIMAGRSPVANFLKEQFAGGQRDWEARAVRPRRHETGLGILRLSGTGRQAGPAVGPPAAGWRAPPPDGVGSAFAGGPGAGP